MTPGPKVERFSCLHEKTSQFEARPRMRKKPVRADFE